ncbi:MAG: hypothetical protein JXR30_03415 [Alphaproteobacteria bacterium]|nr:hypothetical protein [Alphaproteobacteria bacterium]
MIIRESGRTIIETLAVLAIMGVMTVGAISVYSKARKNLLRMESISQINEMADDIQTLFSGRASYDKLTISYLKRMGVIEKDRNPFGEAFSVYPVEETKMFAISYENLGRSDCVYFGTYKWENAENIYINGQKMVLSDITYQCVEGSINTFSLYFR